MGHSWTDGAWALNAGELFSRSANPMSDDRVAAASRSFSDASSSLLLVDTRASQPLEPIRLPTKLRDRIERAQRRANAAKEGVSIFTKDSAILAVGRRTSSAPAAAETTTAATLGEIVDPRRASTATGGLDDKMHLPDVVLSHKMRDFEARANTGGGVALFSMEPADRSLQRLSVEDRERVMLAMQAKIRLIASDVDANFARIKKALDANGIFDSTANIQRAQTLCLVDLQRRCKLDKLRDEAMREVLHLSTSTTAKTSTWPSQLLRPLSQAASASAAFKSVTKRRKPKPVRVSKLPALRTTGGSPSKKTSKNSEPSSLPLSCQRNTGNADEKKSPGLERMRAPPAVTSQSMVREDVGSNGVGMNTSTNDGDLYARHPHVAQVLSFLATGGTSTSKVSGTFNVDSAEAEMEHARILDPADEWTRRCPSYQAVGTRAAEALGRCGERQRWDTLGHFGSRNCSGLGISVPLRQRLEDQHFNWRKSEDTRTSETDKDLGGVPDEGGSGSSNQHERDKEMYTELQTRIRERLVVSERRTRTAAAAVRVVGTSGRRTLSQTAPAKIMTTSSSMPFLSSSGMSPPRGSQQQTLSTGAYCPPLSASASEPVFSASMAMKGASEVPIFSPQKRSRLGSRIRMSVLEQTNLLAPSQSILKHERRKESLIGAPRVQLDSNMIGRHSEARIAYRRDTAQTWAWHVPPGTNSGNVDDGIMEEEAEHNEDKDRFDEEGCGQGEEEDNSEEGEDGTEYGDDDSESVDSNRTSFSARSFMSISSGKRNRKHGKSKRPPTVQRRTSRGSGGRSAGNTLTGHALSLQARLDVIWRVLQFPFSNKLSMLERLSTLQDADAFISALEHWERVTPLVAIRQRMKLALSGYAERGDLRPNEWLTPSEFALVSALSQPGNVCEPSSDVLPPTWVNEFDAMTPSAFVDWTRKHIGAVTLQTHKLANDLKVHTGEELQFQGHPYPRRG